MAGFCVFFFKQKTAYELRISDWSSDVCSSDLKMKKLIGDELKEDAKKYGDDRRCAINARPPAAALVTTEILPAEPVTVVLSKAGWIRAGKGHELDPTALSYKSGDEFAYAVQGKRSEEHTSELQSLMRISYAVFCLKKN